MEGDAQSNIKGLAYSCFIPIMLLIISFYVFGIDAFRDLNLENQAANNLFIYINSHLKIFDSQILYKFLIVILSVPSFAFGFNKPVECYKIRNTIILLIAGLTLLFVHAFGWVYIITSMVGFICFSISLIRINTGEKIKDNDDPFNYIEESFPQEERLIQNKYSVNIPMFFYIKNKKGKLEKRNGWINIINIFKGTLVSGGPGSGKTYGIIEPYTQQLIFKGFAAAIYDFKFPTLTKKVYNYFLEAKKSGIYRQINPEITPRFYVINFDNPAISHRCNPISPSLLKDDADALNVAINVMLALNPEWRRNPDFFANSAMNIFAAILLFLRNHEGGKYCTFPHAVELLSVELDRLIPILLSKKYLENITRPFESAFKNNAFEQVMGQTASAQIPLSRLSSENVYYVSSGNDFELDINDPLEPKIVCIGNNTQKVEAYATPLSLYFYEIIQQVNQQNKWKCTIVVDEFPTVFLGKIDWALNTARSNYVAILLGFQDSVQAQRDYGEAQAKVILSTPGNIISGHLMGESADAISKLFGKKIQYRNSNSISESGVSFSLNQQLEDMFPPSKIANLSQGQMIGKVSDNFDQKIKYKLFNCTIDTDKIKIDESNFVDLPIFTHFSKSSAPDIYIKEWWNDYSQHFLNPDVDYMMQVIMDKANDDNVYTYSLNDFDFDPLKFSPKTQDIFQYKFNRSSLETIDISLIDKFLKYMIGKLTGIGFLASIGPEGKYYVTIWMRSIIRQHYYQIKKDIVDMVDQIELDLLSNPECLKFYRIEYLQKLQKQYEQENQ